MKQTSFITVIAAVVLTAWTSQLWADGVRDCPLAHTHIGVNPTWRPADWASPGSGYVDPTSADDNKLWFFSLPPVHAAATPDWPEWGDDPTQPGTPFLKLVPETDEYGDPITNPGDPTEILWTCRFMYSDEGGYDSSNPNAVQHLDGWHSAHGPQGAWNLESIDESTVPAWDLWLKRESTSVAEDDFFMLLPNETAVLDTDGSTYDLEKMWLDDFNAWGMHEHMTFYFWLPAEDGQEVTATFSAYDTGGLYTASDPFDFDFVTVIPEPGTLALLLGGVLGICGRRRG